MTEREALTKNRTWWRNIFRHHKEVSEVTVEDKLIDPDTINSLKFIQDAISFSIPYCYTKDATVNATVRLLKQTLLEFESPLIKSDFKAIEVGSYKNGVEIYRKDGYPVNADDIEIEQTSHPHRLLGLLKVVSPGEGFFLPNDLIPLRDSTSESILVCLAFSKEMVGRVFPTDIINS